MNSDNTLFYWILAIDYRPLTIDISSSTIDYRPLTFLLLDHFYDTDNGENLGELLFGAGEGGVFEIVVGDELVLVAVALIRIDTADVWAIGDRK